MSDTKINYKKTLNLPQTSFSMKANLTQNEPQTLKRWKKQNLYTKITTNPLHKHTFTFHDGPPYANGSIHVGHLLNKVLKDLVVRSQNILGKKCPFIPGWDCHGLPIEHKVMTEILHDKKAEFEKLDIHTQRKIIRKECAAYASKYIKLQSKQMQRLLTLADYSTPYLTMNKVFEKRALETFAKLVEEGIVYRQLKPVHWSIANKTALADAELEYKDRKDLSVYVDFDAVDSNAISACFNHTVANASFMIWTTTPWTLPANLAIAINPKFIYVLAEHNSRYHIIAKDLVDTVGKISGKTLTIVAETTGKSLVGLRYQHPFCNRSGKTVSADYVTLEDGSGIVHIAPGHGTEDYLVGLEEGLDIYCPVLENGAFDNTVPHWIQGKSVWEGNQIVVNQLKSSNHLFYDYEFSHSYPHDWRSKTPVIFRSTEQWFVNVDKPLKSTQQSLRDMALDAIENTIDFYPGWGQNRLRGMMESRPDWCLSRQRAWGLPIPAFKQSNGEVFMTPASITAVAKIIEKEGSNAWFEKTPAELLAEYDPHSDNEAKAQIDIASLEKMHDIFDVWFESGSSWNGVLNERGLNYPADLYLEGSDQHRGWFHLSLLLSLGASHLSSFKSVLTHGFIVDKDGQKMSKSQGNALNVDDLLQNFGAEITRWWVSSLSFENDIKVDFSFFEVAADAYRKIRNTLRFLLSNIYDLKIKDAQTLNNILNQISTTSVDSLVLQSFSTLQKEVKDAYLNYNFKQANHSIYNFCNDTLSAFYLASVKDRLYCDRPNSQRRKNTQAVLRFICEQLCVLLAPILPHTADEAYRALSDVAEDQSIHLQVLQEFEFKADNAWNKVLDIRSKVLKKLEQAKNNGIENSLDSGILLPDSYRDIEKFSHELPDIFQVSQVHFKGEKITVIDLRSEPRCDRSWKRDGTVKQRLNGGWLSDRDAHAIGI